MAPLSELVQLENGIKLDLMEFGCVEYLGTISSRGVSDTQYDEQSRRSYWDNRYCSKALP
jgi:hypothetical protein